MSRIQIPYPGRARNAYRQAPDVNRSMFGGQSGSSFKMRLMIALAIALFAVLSYVLRPKDENKITGKRERVRLPGHVPKPIDLPNECHFRYRCTHQHTICSQRKPPLRPLTSEHSVACYLYRECSA